MTVDGEVSQPATGILVVGYGNTLRSDDGVGWHAAGLLAVDPRLAGVAVLARHQLTPELALDVRGASLVVFVDASAGGPPGAITVRRLAAGAAGATDGGPLASSHHVGPGVLLALARDLYGAAPEAFVIGIATADTELGEALSPPVAAALAAVADTVADLVAVHLRSRHSPGRRAEAAGSGR